MADREPPAKSVSQDFVFRETSGGGLEFVGDFDGFYRSVEDPWGQSGGEPRMAAYYRYSRANIVKLLATLPERPRVLEVGCGLGHVCRQLWDSGVVSAVTGLDISSAAVAKARRTHPDIPFEVGDFTAAGAARAMGRFDAVILNQLLWYVLGDLPGLLANAHESLESGGYLLLCNAFLRAPQRYGREVVDGFDGIVRYLAANTVGRFDFVAAQLHSDPALCHDDGYVMMRAVGPT